MLLAAWVSFLLVDRLLHRSVRGGTALLHD
jgi:hypothetical protein